MSEKIEVSESPSTTRKVVGAILTVVFALFSVFALVQFLIITERMTDLIRFPLGIVVGFWWILFIFYFRRGGKVLVTPILSVYEDTRQKSDVVEVVKALKPPGSVADAIGGAAADAVMDRAQQSKFILCEEGVVLYPIIGGPVLYRWENIRSYKGHSEGKQFDIYVKGYIGSFSFWTLNSFEEVNKIMMERVTVR